MIVKLLTEHHLEFLSLKGGCKGLSESTLVQMSNCWKSHATAQLYFLLLRSFLSLIANSLDPDKKPYYAVYHWYMKGNHKWSCFLS